MSYTAEVIATAVIILAFTVAVVVGLVGERKRRTHAASLVRPDWQALATTPDTRPLKGRRAGAAHPTDAPRTTPGRHVARGRHAAPATPAPTMVVPTASGRTRSVHTGRMVSAYVAGVLALPLPHHCTVPRV